MRAMRLFVAACLVPPVFCPAGEQGERVPNPGPMQRATSDVPPQVLIGKRVERVRSLFPVSPSVVIVRGSDEFVEAIGRWSPRRRWPVLIDDGTARSREDIGRFVRAFAPSRVLVWAPKAAAEAGGEAGGEDKQGLAERADSAVRRAWGARASETIDELWKELTHEPPGVVVASEKDPAWTAALALAAGRGQPLVWVDSTPAPLGGVTTMDTLRLLDKQITDGLLRTNLAWRAVGDQIEAVTLCLSTQTRVQGEKKDPNKNGLLGTTDVIGRHGDGNRWAWCGMIAGSSAEAAYAAMCALYLRPSSAWVFDGYAPDFAKPYAAGAAVKPLEETGLKVSANLPPRGGISDWRARTRSAVSAELIHVNTSGNAGFFDLTPGRGFGSDVPVLERPAIVHFIHSYSAQTPDDGSTIAGRWLDNGAYAYLGSCDEPYLGAFFPAQVWVERFLAGAPFAVAVRQDTQPPWKLNVFGDPLVQFGAPGPRLEEPLELDGATELEARMRASLKERRLSDAVADMVMLGRDADAVRVAQAAANAEPSAMTPALAKAALLASFRQGERELFLALYRAMDQADQREPLAADLLWSLARAELGSTSDAELLSALRMTIRTHSMAEDAAELAPALRRVFGDNAPRSMIGALLERAPDQSTKQKLAELGGKY